MAGAPHPEVVFPLDNELLADWFSDTVPPKRVARLMP
jgi:hypothetical protein